MTTEESDSAAGANAVSKTKDEFDLAAAYLSDAQYNRNIIFDTSPQAVRLYRFYHHWGLQTFIYLAITVHLGLAVFEEPALIPHVPIWATSTVELICLICFMARLFHYAKVIPAEKFWKDPKNIFIIVIVSSSFIDMIIYISLKMTGHFGVRWSRLLRPLLLVNITEGRQLRRAFRSIRNALPQILYVFCLFMFSVLMFSLMALKLFGKRGLVTVEGNQYFSNYLDIVFDLYVLVTTANSPDVMMPAYNHSSFFAIFFIIFILINTYIFMTVFLAVLYNNYKKYLKEEVRQLVKAKRRKMLQVFFLLHQTGLAQEPVVTKANWNQLVTLVQPGISTAHRDLLWRVSDEDNKGFIGKKAFVDLPDLLNIPVITLKNRPHPFQTCLPNMYESTLSCLVRKMTKSRAFVYVYDIIILVNAVFIGLDEENPLMANAEWVFMALYILEILLKLYTWEPKSFFSKHKFWNWFDTIIVIAALIGTLFNWAVKSSAGYTSRQILDIIFILRVLRLVRVVDSIKRFQAIINTLIKIGPTILTFGQLILVVYYIFAVVGMELFKDKIRFFPSESSNPQREFCGNTALRGTSFARNNYCKNNFNNIISSFVLLLELTAVNQWHVLASGFTAVTHVSARIFFVLFHIVVVIIIINIFIAFILEAFSIEFAVDKSDLQTNMEKKIKELELNIPLDDADGTLVDSMETNDNDVSQGSKGKPPIMFKIASKRSKTVDGLLQRMFEADFNLDDIDKEEENKSFPNPNFESV